MWNTFFFLLYLGCLFLFPFLLEFSRFFEFFSELVFGHWFDKVLFLFNRRRFLRIVDAVEYEFLFERSRLVRKFVFLFNVGYCIVSSLNEEFRISIVFNGICLITCKLFF